MKSNRYLVSRIDRIGDVVLSTPLPREIKRNDPESFVAVLVRHYTKDIYLNNPFVDVIICFDNPDKLEKTVWELVRELIKYKFSHAFMLLPNEKLNYALFLCGIKYRVGVGHKLYQFITFSKYVDRKKYIPLRHEADYNLDMLRKFNIPVKEVYPVIYLSSEEDQLSKEIKSKLTSNGKPIIGVNTTSGNSVPNLSVNIYKELIELLIKSNKYEVLITDFIIPEEIKNIPGARYIFTGESLRSDIIRFSILDVLVSNSTGPMHICAALKVPTFSVFCPLTACSKELWGALGNKSKALLPEKIYCDTQCPIDPKKCDYSKPGGLTAEHVFNELTKFVDSGIQK